MKKNYFLMISFAFAFAINLQAQGDFSIHAGTSIPVSEFGSDDYDNEKAGFAGVGFNLGVKYIYPISSYGLGLYAGADFNFNPIAKKIKDDADEDGLDIDFYKYLNTPLTIGLNYQYGINDNVSFIINGGLSANLLKMTKYEIKTELDEIEIQFDPAYSIGFNLGFGIRVKNISFSGNYYGLGLHHVEGDMKYNEINVDYSDKQKVDLATLTLGYHF